MNCPQCNGYSIEKCKIIYTGCKPSSAIVTKVQQAAVDAMKAARKQQAAKEHEMARRNRRAAAPPPPSRAAARAGNDGKAEPKKENKNGAGMVNAGPKIETHNKGVVKKGGAAVTKTRRKQPAREKKQKIVPKDCGQDQANGQTPVGGQAPVDPADHMDEGEEADKEEEQL